MLIDLTPPGKLLKFRAKLWLRINVFASMQRHITAPLDDAIGEGREASADKPPSETTAQHIEYARQVVVVALGSGPANRLPSLCAAGAEEIFIPCVADDQYSACGISAVLPQGFDNLCR